MSESANLDNSNDTPLVLTSLKFKKKTCSEKFTY